MTTRYAIYFIASGAPAAHGAAWLGWDIATGRAVQHPDLPGEDVAQITERPRKYGFHATIKAPFHLRSGTDAEALRDAALNLCAGLPSVQIAALEVKALGRFLALVPVGDTAAIDTLAAQVVEGLDPFRAAPSQEELARRRKANLSQRQEAHLTRWGYPHVMDDFRFHMTLTGPVPRRDVDQIKERVAEHFASAMRAPLEINALTLVKERADGRWVSVQSLPLG